MHQAVSVLDAVKAHGHSSQKATDPAKCPSHDATTVEQEYLSEYFANGECEQEAFETFAAEMGALDRKQRLLEQEPLPPQTLPIQHKNDDDKENPSSSAGIVPNQPLNPQWPPPPRPDVWGIQSDCTSAFACVFLRERLHLHKYLFTLILIRHNLYSNIRTTSQAAAKTRGKVGINSCERIGQNNLLVDTCQNFSA
jgi:hypothetical protein